MDNKIIVLPKKEYKFIKNGIKSVLFATQYRNICAKDIITLTFEGCEEKIDIFIESVELIRVKNVTNPIANREGYTDSELLKQDLYENLGVSDDDSVYVISFKKHYTSLDIFDKMREASWSYSL